MSLLNYPLTFVWPVDLPGLVCVGGQFERLPDGRILAIYNNRQELAETVVLTVANQQAELERRLEKGLTLLQDNQDATHVARLLQRWAEIIAHHHRVIEARRLVEKELNNKVGK